MDLGQTQAQRGFWYDRGDSMDYISDNAISSPHTLTTQVTYTVGSTKKAKLEMLDLYAIVITAPTTYGEMGWQVTIEEFEALERQLFQRHIGDQSLHSTVEFSLPQPIELLPQTILRIKTLDQSIGSFIDWHQGYYAREYDI